MNFRAKIALAALMLTAGSAGAQIVPYLNSITPQGGGTYLYDYSVDVETGTTVNFNTYFTIYDLYGLQSVSTSPTSWTNSVQDVGQTPAGTAPPENNSVPNVTWTYTGGPSISGDPTAGYTFLGDFDIVTTQGVANADLGFYTYQALESDNGDQQTGISFVSTPLAPEPAALGFFAPALLALRRKTRRADQR